MRKKEIKKKNINGNSYSSVLLFRARANILELNRQRHNKFTKTQVAKCVEQNMNT